MLKFRNRLPAEAAFADVVVAGHRDWDFEQRLADDALENLLDLGVPLLQKKWKYLLLLVPK